MLGTILQKLLGGLPPPLPWPVSMWRFEGAAGGVRLANAGVMPNPAASVLAARGRLASRVRYLVANNPLAASAAEGWAMGLVGTGIVAQSAHPSPYVRAIINRRAQGCQSTSHSPPARVRISSGCFPLGQPAFGSPSPIPQR